MTSAHWCGNGKRHHAGYHGGSSVGNELTKAHYAMLHSQLDTIRGAQPRNGLNFVTDGVRILSDSVAAARARSKSLTAECRHTFVADGGYRPGLPRLRHCDAGLVVLRSVL